MTDTTKERLAYSVGGLLYVPALKEGLADKIAAGKLPDLMSLAFCLEDSIADRSVGRAEKVLVHTFDELAAISPKLPLVFVRVRSPEHLSHLHRLLAPYTAVITGYVLPKFDLSNAAAYLTRAEEINSTAERKIYIMPTLETHSVADIAHRRTALTELSAMLAAHKNIILNIRVGANDFCRLYGLRRGIGQTIYDIGVVREILTDILTVFLPDYVVSGPVWEYFGSVGKAWEKGLERELELDLANGFCGKTAIHPSQLPVIRRALRVSAADYADACQILDWTAADLGVQKSSAGGRMNEVKCHRRWAGRIKLLGDIYGVKSDGEEKP